MRYPEQIIIMAQIFIDEHEENVELQETRLYMLWNTILNLHFPFTLGYGIALQTSITGTGTKQDFFIVKTIRGSAVDVVVVVGLKSSGETMAEMDTLQAELAGFIKECFSQTQYPIICGIGGVGLSIHIVPTCVIPAFDSIFSLLSTIINEPACSSATSTPGYRVAPREFEYIMDTCPCHLTLAERCARAYSASTI